MKTRFSHDIFISYSSADTQTAMDICSGLEEKGMKCWIAPRDVVAGEDYARLIEGAIIHAKVFLLICSASAMQSRWVIGELNIAFNEGKRIVPVRIDDTELEGSFRLMINQLHIVQHDQSIIREISDILESMDMTPAPGKRSIKGGLFIALPFLAVAAIIMTLVIRPWEKPEPSSRGTISVTETDTSIVIDIAGHSFRMIAVEPGEFMMGTDDSYEQDPKPMHKVTISRKYYLGETEVTQGVWKAVMGSLPCEYSGAQKPVEGCSWNLCADFIERLSAITGMTFRFPTEAEWEYAAKGGLHGGGFRFSGSNDADEVAWFDKAKVMHEEDGTRFESGSGRKSVDVKGKVPNRLGIYDMSGNVEEWCADWYGTYEPGHQTDPVRTEMQRENWNLRIIRGGSYLTTNESKLLNTYRSCNIPANTDGTKGDKEFYRGTGLRLAISSD